jgi:uncharacterized protein (TIGR02145 family)
MQGRLSKRLSMESAKGFFAIVIIAGFLMFPGCNKDSPLPEVGTTLVVKIFEQSAESGGLITSEGVGPVTARGVCWSTSPDPTISDSRNDEGKGPGSFQSIIIGLTATTVYHVRAFATNRAGTAYGKDVMFKTLSPTIQAGPTGTLSDQGTVYQTKKIGTQTWMTDNLTARVFADGTTIPIVRQDTWYSLTTPASCWVQDDDSRTIVYGLLYNFYAVTDPRNVCPNGWHVPSLNEWETMVAELGGNDVAGGMLKEKGTTHWTDPNVGASDGSGFTGLPAGIRDQSRYIDFTISGYFWTSTSKDDGFGQIEALRYSTGNVFSAQYPKTAGASVRCVQN